MPDSSGALGRVKGSPRPLIDAIVDCIQPTPGEVVADPTCGTGGFLLSAHRYIEQHHKLDKTQKRALRYDALRGIEFVEPLILPHSYGHLSPLVGVA